MFYEPLPPTNGVLFLFFAGFLFVLLGYFVLGYPKFSAKETKKHSSMNWQGFIEYVCKQSGSLEYEYLQQTEWKIGILSGKHV